MVLSSQILLVGGTGRNIGKTTFMELLIRKFSNTYPLVALKTSFLLPGSERFHGHPALITENRFLLTEEKESSGQKDSRRYLQAGARRSFFLSAGKNAVDNGWQAFLKSIQDGSLVVVESNALFESVSPALFIMIDDGKPKPGTQRLLKQADLIVPALNGKVFAHAVGQIDIKNGRWVKSRSDLSEHGYFL